MSAPNTTLPPDEVRSKRIFQTLECKATVVVPPYLNYFKPSFSSRFHMESTEALHRMLLYKMRTSCYW